MSVKINIPSYFQYFTNNTSLVEVECGSVKDCLWELVKKYPGMKPLLFENNGNIQFQPLNHVLVLKNGIAVQNNEYADNVNDGDELELSYVILGG